MQRHSDAKMRQMHEVQLGHVARSLFNGPNGFPTPSPAQPSPAQPSPPLPPPPPPPSSPYHKKQVHGAQEQPGAAAMEALPAVRPNVGQKFAQVVHTDGVAISLMFIRPKPTDPPDKLPCMGKEEGAVNPLAHLDADWLGCDPGKTNMATVAHEERYPSGAVKSVWQRRLTAGQYYRQSGITEHAKESKVWTADIKPQHDLLSQVTNYTASLQRYREYADTTLVNWPAMWAEMSKRRWSNARFRLYGGKQRTVAEFWAEELCRSMEKMCWSILDWSSSTVLRPQTASLLRQLVAAGTRDLYALVAPTVDDAIRAAITNHKALVAAAGSDFDVLLGNDWLNEHEAVMSYQDKTLSLACDKSEPVVLPCPSAGVSQSGQSAVSNPASFLVNALRAKPPLASAKVAARWLRKGGTGVLALITVDNSSTPDPAPAEPDLPPGVSQALNALLDEYADVFAPITSLPPERPVGHAIPLVPDARPSVVPQYRMSQDEHAELKKQVQDLLAKGMIEPSSSPFAAPILFVKKKSGELRMCLDYRQLNKITIRDQYPLPRIDDLFDKLSGCTVFSSLDLQAGYNQIRITPEDVPKTAFRTPDGHYQFKVLSFGLCNAPATFQRVMNDAFAPVLNQCALVYLDDILVMSKSVDEHLKHLRKVFDLLRLNKLYAKQSKCEFMRSTLKFLGHVIFAGAIAVDPEKIKSISAWPVPQSLQQLQSFLGVGAVLMQDGYPLAYLSKKLSSAERNYTTADLSGMYMDDHGLWRRTGKGTVMVPNDPELREYILHEMHDAAYAGHVGITKTLERLSRVFYWDTMRADVRHYVTTCDACQRDKSSTLKPGGLLNPLSIPDYRWESVSMDLITKLPSASHGLDAICVFVDRLSKMVHFVPCKESMNAKGFARLFVDNVFKLHGLPKDMVSDRGPHFHNTFWHHVQKLLGMRGSLSSSYHPQSDGQTERYNRVLEEMLRHYISPTQADWPDYLSLAEFAVNNSWQESIKSTPFLVNTGQSPITPMLHSLPDKGRCPEGLSYATWWQEAVAKAKLCMQAAQQRQAAYANQDRREVHYKVGQMVLLSTKNMRLKPGKARKLPRFVGPFKVLGLVGQVVVNLQLPASMSRLHPVFHVSLIKPYTGTDVGFMPPPVEWLDEEPVYYVERLLDHRHVHAGKAKEYLVQWEGYDAEHNTWEPRSNLVGCDKILAEYNAAHNLKQCESRGFTRGGTEAPLEGEECKVRTSGRDCRFASSGLSRECEPSRDAGYTCRTVKCARARCNSAATGRPLALAYGPAGFSGSGSIGSKGVPVKQMRREACKQFPGRVMLVHEFRTSRVSSARTNVVEGQAESFKWLYPVRSMATRSRIRGLMCSTSNGIRFYDRDVSAALNIARIAAGPGRPRELSNWLGRPAMPNPGRAGQEWVQVRDRGLLRKWQRRHQWQR
ncbi:hypothetical protein QJQ45_010295 [Haematococcus lacustris]|nr:hypothetical protein QJQ45_010295 [Haematococcus lacustris]